MATRGGRSGGSALDRVGSLLDSRIGLRVDLSLRSRLRRCVEDAARSRALTVDRYVDSLGTDDVALQDLLDRVTVQETSFFRHPGQFAALAEHVLPEVAGPARIWCAAAANGQEPYSLAMVLAEQGRAGEVLATDVSAAALRRTTAAWYSDREIRGLSPPRRAAHLTARDGGWQLSAELRSRAKVRPHNLLQPIPPEASGCQIVFCRNVLIYFSAGHTTTFLESLADVLAPGAYLFLGAAETIGPATGRFEPVQLGDSFVYRARARTPRAPIAPAPTPARTRRPGGATGGAADGGTGGATGRATRAPVAAPRGAPAPPPARPADADVEAAAGAGSATPATTGLEALRTGNPAAAVVAFRQWAYLDPDDPQAHLHLALALEAAGDHRAARRAFRTARAALEHADAARLDASLGSYEVAELHRLLAAKSEVR
jgi:chemotaxis protein methyltransferase CheR